MNLVRRAIPLENGRGGNKVALRHDHYLEDGKGALQCSLGKRHREAILNY